MDRSLLLPLPRFKEWKKRSSAAVDDAKEISFWSSKLRKLSADPSLWTETVGLLKKLEAPCQHALAQNAADGEGRSLLHLAVLNDCFECASLLSQDRDLLERRNQFGLTPLELALYLHKLKMVKILSGNEPQRSFTNQPNVLFEEAAPDLEYLPHPIFESQRAMDEILTRTLKAKQDDAISQDRIWMGVYYDREIQEDLHPKLAVRKINEEIGLGVFAAEKIFPCTYLGEYTGLIRPLNRREDGESVYSFSYTAWRMGRRPYVINAERMGNFTRFINHSDDPSAEAICVYWRGMPRMILISRREIPEGGQIHFDYGETFWKQVSHLAKRPL